MRVKKDFTLKRINGCYGYYWNGQIVLSKKLTSKYTPSKRFVYWHEKFHAYLEKSGIKLPASLEEKACDFYSLFKCDARELGFLENELKKIIINSMGRKPSKRDIIKFIKQDMKISFRSRR